MQRPYCRMPLTPRAPALIAVLLCSIGVDAAESGPEVSADPLVQQVAQPEEGTSMRPPTPVLPRPKGIPQELRPVIVTAQKRSERQQDVPLSVTSIEAETLLEQNTLNARDYLTRVPGFTLNEVGSGESQPVIRGISTGFGGN